jgi:hypothetical protein
MPELIGYHSCAADGGEVHVLHNAPFLSRFDNSKPHKLPFLGEGRYLWDDDLDAALWWGGVAYSGVYYVVKVQAPYKDDELLDLCDREQLRMWVRLVERLESKGHMARRIPAGMVFQVLRSLHLRHKSWNLFPWTIVRAVETLPKGRAPRRFRHHSSSLSFLEQMPIWIFCLFSNYDITLLRKEVVHRPATN